jgi:hypothetical protein
MNIPFLTEEEQRELNENNPYFKKEKEFVEPIRESEFLRSVWFANEDDDYDDYCKRGSLD